MNAKDKARLRDIAYGLAAGIIITHWSTVMACVHVIHPGSAA